MPRKLSFIAVLITFCISCNTINAPLQTPTYIHIDSFQFFPNSTKGNSPTLSHQIPVVWVYYNNNPVGEFDLPVTFPVITTGGAPGKLELYPGIIINGLNDHVDIYPFYQPDTSFAFIPQPGKVLTYEPKTSYFSDAVIYSISNFDNNYLGFKCIAGAPIQIISPPNSLVFGGSGGSGMIYMTNPGVDSTIDSSFHFSIPSGDAYIEFNYKSDVPFSVSLQSNLSSFISAAPIPLAGVNPSATWQKFYVSLTQFTLQYTGANYNFYIQASLPSDQATGTILLDNIQLVTF